MRKVAENTRTVRICSRVVTAMGGKARRHVVQFFGPDVRHPHLSEIEIRNLEQSHGWAIMRREF